MADKPQFTPEQEQAITETGGSVLVSAAAGSGNVELPEATASAETTAAPTALLSSGIGENASGAGTDRIDQRRPSSQASVLPSGENEGLRPGPALHQVPSARFAT